MRNTGSVSELKTLKNALDMLRFLETRELAGVTDIAQELGISTSAVHRICSTLLAEGLLEQNSGARKYALGKGVVLWETSSAIERLLAIAPPYLRSLRDSTEETVHIAVRTGLRVSFPLAFESPLELRVGSRVGKTAPVHTSANGKVLLAAMTDQEIRHLLGGHAFEAPTPYSISSLDRLTKEIADVRRRGYATNVSETETGVYTMAVAVKDEDGQAICSMSVSAPVFRVQRSADQQSGVPERRLLDALMLCSQRMSSELSA
jgi:DNA-binding IclR family transcriptional regulator